MSHSPIHNCPNCTCGMIELTWSDRAAFVFPEDAEGIADAIVSCAFDHYYDRTDTGVPDGLPDEISVVCAEIVARRLDVFYPGWRDSTIPWSKDGDKEEERLREELVTKLRTVLHVGEPKDAK